MGVKKPAVIAKTANKRGRPVGSKNKPKDKPVDWEKLAKQLQTALASEMKENENLDQVVKLLKAYVEATTTMPFLARLKYLFTGNF